MTEADVCKRIQVLLSSERKGEDFDDAMMVEQKNGLEKEELVSRIDEFKEKELENVANHLERLRNEKFNPQISEIGQMLSNNLETLRNTKRNLDKERIQNNGP